MWERYLQGDLLTPNCLLTFGSLLSFEVDRGIDDAWWGPAPSTSADDEMPEAGADEDVAALDRAGIDQGDLLALLNEPSEPVRSADVPASRTRRRAAKGPARTGGRNKRSHR